MLKFDHLGLNHSNKDCKSILLSKLCCLQSTFASNDRYLSSKYNISYNDWFTIVSHLIGKVKMRFQQNPRSSTKEISRTWALLCLQTVILTNTLIMFTSSVLASQGEF